MKWSPREFMLIVKFCVVAIYKLTNLLMPCLQGRPADFLQACSSDFRIFKPYLVTLSIYVIFYYKKGFEF